MVEVLPLVVLLVASLLIGSRDAYAHAEYSIACFNLREIPEPLAVGAHVDVGHAVRVPTRVPNPDVVAFVRKNKP